MILYGRNFLRPVCCLSENDFELNRISQVTHLFILKLFNPVTNLFLLLIKCKLSIYSKPLAIKV